MALSQEAFIYLAVSVFCFIFCFLSWRRRLVKSAWELCVLTMMTGFWAFTLFCESVAQSVEIKLLWVKVSYAFVTTTPVFYLLLVLKFTDISALKYWYHQLFLFAVPIVTILLTWTNDQHQLVWTGWDPLETTNELIHFHRGLWFWIGVMLNSYILLMASTWLMVVFLRKRRDVFGTGRTILLLIGALAPWLTSVLFFVGINHSMTALITPIMILFTCAIYILGILYAGFYNFLPMARELLVENLPDGIVALDRLDRIQDINAMARIQLGYSPTSTGSIDLKALKSPYHSLAAALLTPDSCEWVQHGSGMSVRTYQLIKMPIQTSAGCRIVIIRDVTEQKQAEKAILEAKEKAEASDRLKLAFLANMSHEIRTPMNSILGFVSLMLDEGVDEAEQRTYLTIVKQNSERLLGTLNDVLDLSRIEAGQVTVSPSDFNLMDVLNNVVSLYSKQAEDKQLTFLHRCEIPVNLSYIHTDKEKLFSILSNLVSNALKFTAKGSVELTCALSARRLVITVKDTGTGISVEKQSHIFERFVQGDTSHNRPYEGSGLGLAITKSYVDMLKGNLSLESTAGEGSVFRVSLPVKQAQSLSKQIT